MSEPREHKDLRYRGKAAWSKVSEAKWGEKDTKCERGPVQCIRRAPYGDEVQCKL